jgi:quercetin dioxygenase-like cupin family protein
VPAIKIVDPADVPWLAPKEGTKRDLVPVDRTQVPSSVQYPHMGTDDRLHLQEVAFGPNVETEVHAHKTDEIIYVTGGEMHLGAHVLRPGHSVYIPADTLYGFHAGPDGLTFLNFRACRDDRHLSKAEFMAEKRAKSTA